MFIHTEVLCLGFVKHSLQWFTTFGWVVLLQRLCTYPQQRAAYVVSLSMIGSRPFLTCAAHLSSVHSRRVCRFSGESCSISVSLPYVLMYQCATISQWKSIEVYLTVFPRILYLFVRVDVCVWKWPQQSITCQKFGVDIITPFPFGHAYLFFFGLFTSLPLVKPVY